MTNARVFSPDNDVFPLMDEASRMQQAAPTVRTLSELRQYVHETLCRHENLETDQFQLQEVPLSRSGERCGLQFILRGPRNVRLGAVWASDRNQIFFYNAVGERFRKQQLAETVTDFLAIPAG